MEKTSNNSGFKVVILLLALLLSGSIWYIFKVKGDSKAVETTLTSEKDKLVKELKLAADSLSVAIASNTTMSEELTAERERIEQLMAEVQKSKGDVASMAKYKVEANKLRNSVATLLEQVGLLRKQNEKLTVERDSTATVLCEVKKLSDTLTAQNSKMASTIEKGSRLSVLNLVVSAVRQKSSGKQISTDKASKADVLKISFMIAENQIAKSEDKTYYIQIIDAKNNVQGELKNKVFGEKSLTYSFETLVKYENKTVKVEKDLPVTNLEKGSYFVNIFDKAELISKTNFTLR